MRESCQERRVLADRVLVFLRPGSTQPLVLCQELVGMACGDRYDPTWPLRPCEVRAAWDVVAPGYCLMITRSAHALAIRSKTSYCLESTRHCQKCYGKVARQKQRSQKELEEDSCSTYQTYRDVKHIASSGWPWRLLWPFGPKNFSFSFLLPKITGKGRKSTCLRMAMAHSTCHSASLLDVSYSSCKLRKNFPPSVTEGGRFFPQFMKMDQHS